MKIIYLLTKLKHKIYIVSVLKYEDCGEETLIVNMKYEDCEYCGGRNINCKHEIRGLWVRGGGRNIYCKHECLGRKINYQENFFYWRKEKWIIWNKDLFLWGKKINHLSFTILTLRRNKIKLKKLFYFLMILFYFLLTYKYKIVNDRYINFPLDFFHTPGLTHQNRLRT